MSELVTLTVDGIQVSVPVGTLVVEAARKAGVAIPVFCYHPKMEPVGMCRMCLVEIGRPVVNRTSGEFETAEDGSLVVQFGTKLETGCTVPASEGMVVRGYTENVARGREDILEFLLTSHPLDCPICDKGGECPLQNLTMDFGPGTSRFIYDEKYHLAKHSPLGDLILLDQERCIQCGRCVRFQDEIVDDPVIGFSQRGRALQIVTFSEPGFDSYFSGNTTDICPVGALTTRDFRFAARPWEMSYAASICPHCPVGCNLTLNVRREDKSGGGMVVKRVMPRQNEQVNEIWICDKGRFAYHYTQDEGRLTAPLARKDGELVPVSWQQALDLVAARMGEAGARTVTLAGGRLANEDLFNLKQLSQHLGGQAVLYGHMAGGDLVAQLGTRQGSDIAEMGPETAILVVACDLEEEAPLYWLRVKQAAERGAKLLVVNPRPTKLERYASQVLRYAYGAEASAVVALLNALSAKRSQLPEAGREFAKSVEVKQAADMLAAAENLVVLYGNEGTGLQSSRRLAQACANLLIATGHTGQANNGLIAVWPHANTQGAWELGFRPQDELEACLQGAEALYVAAADPAGDDPVLARALAGAGFLVVQELSLTATAQLADVVLPAQAYTERHGSYTNGERRVQRFYLAVPPRGQARPDFAISAQIGERLGAQLESGLAEQVFARLAAEVPAYAGLTYQQLAEVAEQWPQIGRDDLYYGGTAYENRQGMGARLHPGGPPSLGWVQPEQASQAAECWLLAVPVTRLYDRGRTMLESGPLSARIPRPFIMVNLQDAGALNLQDGDAVLLDLEAFEVEVRLRISQEVPAGIVLAPRSFGIPLHGPLAVRIKRSERVMV